MFKNKLYFFKLIFHRINLFFHSIRFRLMSWSLAILAIVLIGFSTFVYTNQYREINDQAINHLDQIIRPIQAAYRIRGMMFTSNGDMRLSDMTIYDPRGMIVTESEVMALVDQDDQIIQKIGGGSDTDILRLVEKWQQTSPKVNPMEYQLAEKTSAGESYSRKYYMFVAPVPIMMMGQMNGSQGMASMGETENAYLILGAAIDPNGQLPRLVFRLAVGSLTILLITLAGGYWLAGKVMQPVQTITRTAREISETDLRRRIDLGTQDELGELADTFDQMLARLQAAFDRQRQFTADASHELRTPLTIVELETERALSRRRSPEEYEHALKIIKSENEFTGQLVNDLLTLARMDAGQATLNLEPLDLSDLALDVVERLGPLAQSKGINLSTGDLPELKITGDRQYLSRMLTNLVENAIKYSNGDNKQVRVETGSSTTGDSLTCWVRVEDNGIGIPAEHLSHIFDRFYRVDKARTHPSNETGVVASDEEEPSGSGLGLSIAQWIIQAHGGQIQVKSEVGKGSVFEVFLPLTEA